jgi:UDP-N-acetylglucosamine 2-epimerase (non-hydrolysing)
VIIFVFGTTAEAIKLAPIARRLDARGIAYESWLTMQHTDALVESMQELGFRPADRIIANGNKGQSLRGFGDVIVWLLEIRRWMRKNVRTLRSVHGTTSVVVVHGDTMTSVVGSYIAKRVRVSSAHVEAGLRSGNWRHPFPEELDRRVVGTMATIHYTPSEEATENLRGKANVVYTHGNTVIDAVVDHEATLGTGGEKYGVVLLHRFEYLANRRLVEETMATLTAESPFALKFIVDDYAKETLADILPKANTDRIQIQGKLAHDEFIAVLKRAEFVVTDSGGIQAEAALIGLPTLIHRKATEQREGIGLNIVLSEWKIDALSAFLADFAKYAHPGSKPEYSPSDIIVDDLIARGFGNA